MISIAKSLAITAGITVIAAPASFAYFSGWTIYETAEPAKPTLTVRTPSDCSTLGHGGCAAERSFSREFNYEAASILKVGAKLDRDQPRFTQTVGSAVEVAPEGEVYVIWDQHLVRIVERNREITKVYFNAF